MPLFFIDSNVFIYSQVKDLPECELAKAKLDEVKSRGEIAVNAIIISECFYVLSRFIGDEEAAKRIGLFLESSKVLYLSIEKTTLTKAIRLAVAHKHKINDMIIAQHALDAKADGLLTDNTKHFSGVPELTTQNMR
ncbi:MAG: type II toxin-antitoxin system VapC family toxin [Nitrososphaerales archaeon]